MNRCPKCTGLIATYHDETRCLQCGYRHGDLNREIGNEGFVKDAPDGRLCSGCQKYPRMLHRKCCKTCLYRAAKRLQAVRHQGVCVNVGEVSA